MRACVLLLAVGLLAGGPAAATPLKAMYDQAGPAGGYERYIVLQAGVTYTGGLWLGATYNPITGLFEGGDETVRIVGSGAILDLRGAEICIAYCNGRLDLDDCVILNGNVRFRGYDGGGQYLMPRGSVRYVTFYKPLDYGVRLFHCGADIVVERNLVVDVIDTGPDFQYLTGMPSDWLPTGTSFTLSLAFAGMGVHEVYHNWTYHSDPAANADALRHFTILCDYG